MWEIRKKKIESLLLHKISEMIYGGEIKDPRITSMITLTEIRVTRDLKEASVFVSCMEGENRKKNIIRVLNHASGHIQKLLARKVRMKSTPHLKFLLDDSLERGFNISRKLKELSD